MKRYMPFVVALIALLSSAMITACATSPDRSRDEARRAAAARVRGSAAARHAELDRVTGRAPAAADDGVSESGEPFEPARSFGQARESDDKTMFGEGSSGRSRSDAVTMALTDIARQISVRIESEIRIIEGETGRSGAAETISHYWEDVRSSVSFAHGALAQQVAYRPPSETGGRHWVQMALSRRAAANAIADEVANYQREFAIAVARAQAALERRDREAAALAWLSLRRTAVVLDSNDIQRRAILRAPIPDQEQRRQTLAVIAGGLAEMREKITFVVVPEVEDQGDITRTAAEAVAAVLGGLGLRARVSAAGPPRQGRGPGETIELAVRGNPTSCRRAPLGHQCLVTVDIAARSLLEQSDLFRMTAQAAGLNASRQRRAKHDAIRRLPEEIMNELPGLLAPHVPLP